MAGPGRRTNFALLLLLVIALMTGLLAFAVGETGWARPVVLLHGAAGLAVLLLVPWKSVIVRRGLRRPGTARRLASLGLATLVVVVVGSGLLHALGGYQTYLGLLPMQLHVGAALLAISLLAGHLWVHRRRREFLPRRTDLSRRVALRAAGVVAGASVLYAAAGVAAMARRETGSHEVGSGDPRLMPVTQWLFDAVPAVDAASWRLSVPTGELDVGALSALPQRTVRAVLDCTGGWYSEQDWRGVPLDVLVGAVGAAPTRAASVAVTSTTGYTRLLPVEDLAGLLLATQVGGQPLSAGHGGPARLVAPGRRGFWWVKWVSRVELVDTPWWWQPPMPTQ